jgi:PKD repeat protein/N-acetyl-anhydromuramyl-L-alanine amidase AmpD
MLNRILFCALILSVLGNNCRAQTNENLVANPYQAEFAAAYQAYPNIPAGALEAVSHTTTRMNHLTIFEQESCLGLPRAYGLMGLILDGKGYFRNNLKTVSRLSGISENDIIVNPASHVMAYASAFNFLLDSLGLAGAALEDQAYVFVLLSEIPQDGNPVNDFALNSHLYSVLTFMKESDYQQFYGFPAHQVDMERIFGQQNLAVLSATSVSLGNGAIQSNSSTYIPQSQRSPDYGPGIWTPAPSCNYSSRSGTAVSAITIHTVQGSYAGAISWAQNCSSNVSYHYVVRSSDGQVTQMVYETDKGWHVGSENPYTIGYEHEGYVSSPSWYTTALYNASSDISRDIVNSGYGINPLRTYYGASSTGINTLGSCIRIKGHQHYPNQTHTDPGIYWDWERYYKLINNNPSVTSLTATTGSFYDSGGAGAAYDDDERTVTTIAPPGATSVTLTFSQFDLETNWDYLFIYDGATVNDPLIGVYTGTTSPGSITATGGALTVEFRSDCATVNPGWVATWTSNATPPPPVDNVAPTTAVSAPSAWITQDFTATFTDADNTGGSGVGEHYYSVIHFDGTEWRGNASNGFFSDNFDAAIHPDWTSVTGTWAISGGVLVQSDETNTNTNLYAALNQNQADAYLYHWAGSISGSGTNRRAGLHFMVDSPTLTNRGNSYFVWFRADSDKIQIYEVVNDVFTLEADITYDFNAGQWYDFKTTYNTITGLIDVYVDNDLAASWTDATPLSSGDYISLRSGDCIYSVNNMKVFKSRGTSETVTVGMGNDLAYQNPDPVTAAGKVKSFVIDVAKNISAEGQQSLNVDWTAPADVPLVEDGDANDIDIFYNNTEIRANWLVTGDQHSGMARYWYSIGTSAGATNVVGWTDNWNFDTLVRSGLSLSVGTTYYVNVRAENGAGLQSNVVSSDGQLLDNPVGTPVASFIAGNTIICQGESIVLTNNSQNAATYSWNMPGATPSTSTQASPAVTFASSGTYTITLTATGPGGTDTDVQTLNVDVSVPPVAQFTPSATTVNLPSALVTFTNTSANANAWLWDFGNGATSTDQNPWYQYTTTGTYTVMLIALNNGCPSDTAFATITVGVNGIQESSQLQAVIRPMPATDEAVLGAMLPSPALTGVKILDASGRLVWTSPETMLSGHVAIPLPVSQLSAGYYIVQLRTGNTLTVLDLIVE